MMCAMRQMILRPPGAPTVRKGCPSLSTKTGVMLFRPRLNPAIEFAVPGMGFEDDHTVSEQHAGAGHDDIGAECAYRGLGACDHVPVFVDDAEMGGAVAIARRRCRGRMFGTRLGVVAPRVVQGIVGVGNPWLKLALCSRAFAASRSMEFASLPRVFAWT